MPSVPQVICPLRSVGRDTVYCNTSCAWYINDPKQPGCALAHIVYLLAKLNTKIQ